METPAKQPKTLLEAIRYFSDLDFATQYFAKHRWPDGPVCPHCGTLDPKHYYLKTRRKWRCRACKKQFSVKVGTVLEDSPIGLDKWLPAMWMLVNCKNGKSSYELARDLGIQQKSAWFMLHRIRLAMQTGTFEKLSGEVEADETSIGGKARNMHKGKREEKITGRGASGKVAVMGLLERHGKVKTICWITQFWNSNGFNSSSSSGVTGIPTSFILLAVAVPPIFSIRAFIRPTAVGLMSMPIHCLLRRSATATVVPQPQNGSSTTSPSLLLALMMRSKSASGFWVG